MTSQVVPVSLLSSYIRQLFETDALLSDVWVEGEVSEVFVSRAGHVYFTLRDAESQIKSVLFKGAAQRQRIVPVVGDQIAAHGRVTTYERDGVYQLYVDVIEHAGQGLFALQFEQLRQKLETEGLFDQSRKRALPDMPRTIGVVTSEQGAVWHDIQTVLRRRYPLAELVLSPAPVQGANAPEGIVRAIDLIQRDGRSELLIIARGGGSVEDLSCFNDERVARAVFACRIPVISAIGHETDWTIIDYVADLRAPTPSAAAELCAPSIDSLYESARLLQERATAAFLTFQREGREEVATFGRMLERHTPVSLIERNRREISQLKLAVGASRRAMIVPGKSMLERECERLSLMTKTSIIAKRTQSQRSFDVLQALNPISVMARGFAVLEDAVSGNLIIDSTSATVGQQITAHLADGSIRAKIERVDADRGVRHNG